jgi:hypothetical protein
MKVKNKSIILKVKEQLLNNVRKIENQPKTLEMLCTNEYSLTLHEKEVSKRLIRIIDESGLK